MTPLEQAAAGIAALPQQHYRLIYIDPPWKFSAGPSKNPSNHYPTMPLRDIAQLPIRDLAHPEGCRLLMWITVPIMLLPFGPREVMKAWGFRYSSARVWGKLWEREAGAFLYPDSFARGPGYEVIGNCELLVIGKRRKAPPIIGTRKPGSLFFGIRREHSRKPDIIREEAARIYPGPRVEIFARSTAPDWDSWGNEVNKFDGSLPARNAA